MQLVANAVLLVAANTLGLTSYSIIDKQQRRAFEDTRKSLKTKLVVEEQSAEQVRCGAVALDLTLSQGKH